MNSCGVIVRYMSRQDWKGEKFLIKLRTMFFNLCLLIYQLVLIIVGTVYGKIKWGKPLLIVRVLSGIGVAVTVASMVNVTICGPWYLFFYFAVAFIYFVAYYRGIDWRKTWRAAKASHVRLVLEETAPEDYPGVWNCINFGYPKAEIQTWLPSWNKGNHRYFDPTFDPSPEFIQAMIDYACVQVGKRYDDYQLISNAFHLIAWIVMPWWWGEELRIIKALNRKGGCEHCISGVTACLRWAEYVATWRNEGTTRFFVGYSTATTSPCLVPLSKNWEIR